MQGNIPVAQKSVKTSSAKLENTPGLRTPSQRGDKVHKQMAEGEKFQSLNPSKGSISQTYKKLLQINKKKTATPTGKKGKEYEQANYKKRNFKCIIKRTMRHHYQTSES